MRRLASFLWWRVWPWHRKDPLLTAVIARESRGWTIWWTDTASFSPGGAFQTLDWLVQATDTRLREAGGAFQTLSALVDAIDALVIGRDPGGRGCLQYMVYPWGRPGVGDDRLPFDVSLVRAPESNGGETMPETPSHTAFHISGKPGDLLATEINFGATLEVHGHSADDLVSQVADLRGQRPDSFTWIRDIRTLQHAD